MKGPITYFGGKRQAINNIIPLFPPHKHYCELFFGGGSIFFAKPKAMLNSINDIDAELYNFYKVLQDDKKLEKLIYLLELSPHCQKDLQESKKYLKENKFTKIDVERARKFYTLTQYSFACKKEAFGFSVRCNRMLNTKLINKLKNFTQIAEKLKGVQIFNQDYLKLIKKLDSKDTFFYLDPPYPETAQKCYKGKFSVSDFDILLKTLSKIKGKFLVSCYKNEALTPTINKYKFREYFFNKNVGLCKKYKVKKAQECCLMNY